MATPTTIDVKSAVRIAIDYLREFNEFMPLRDFRLEEVEFDESGSWLITLSAEEVNPGPFAALELSKRNYKRFRIDAQTGEVKSMKVRTLQPID